MIVDVVFFSTKGPNIVMMRVPVSRHVGTHRFLLFFLCVASMQVKAFPALPPFQDTTSNDLYMSLNSSLSTFDMRKLHCDKTLGDLDYKDCEEAIKLLPHDPIGKPVLRNFYTNPPDVSATIANQQLPFEKTYGR